MSRELEGWRRYAIVFGGILISAGICALAARSSVSASGTIGPTVLQAQSVPAAAAVTLVCFAAATGIACVVGRYVNAAVGLFVLGTGLWALRLRLGTVEDLAFGNGSLGLVALETALWGGVVLGATLAVFRVAGPLPDIAPEGDGPEPRPWWNGLGLRGVAAGLLILPAVWLIARSELRGQTLAAVTLGSMAVGLAGRLLSPHAQPRLLFAAPCLFGALGHLVGMMTMNVSLADAFVTQSIPAVNLPMPIDYAAGSLMGVAMGLGWAKSFLQHDETAPQPAE